MFKMLNCLHIGENNVGSYILPQDVSLFILVESNITLGSRAPTVLKIAYIWASLR